MTTQPAPPEPIVRATRYEVNYIPEDDDNRHSFTVTIEYRGRDRWAVCRHQQCLSSDGTWSFESRPSEREDEWLAEHRFDLTTAQRLAREAARRVTVNGWTVDDALAMRAASTDAEVDAVWARIRARIASGAEGSAR